MRLRWSNGKSIFIKETMRLKTNFDFRTEQVGLALIGRDLSSITLQLKQPPNESYRKSENENVSINTAVTNLSTNSKTDLNSPSSSGSSLSLTENILKFQILQVFPFTSESKKMGIIVKDNTSGEITFYLKGADMVSSFINFSLTQWK